MAIPKRRSQRPTSVLASLLMCCALLQCLGHADAFAIPPTSTSAAASKSTTMPESLPTPRSRPQQQSTTQLGALVNVPDHFFAISLPTLGIISAWSNRFTRRRLEERAWEQRVEEARERRLREDPLVSEIELRRQEAALEWSAYGKPRQLEEEKQRRMEERRQQAEQSGRRRRVAVADAEDFDEDDEDLERRTYRMTDAEIDRFETDFGIDFDPYYDDPYTEEELPSDISFRLDKKYGDRIYENGEIFYKDKATGLFYRQGAKPKNLAFWK